MNRSEYHAMRQKYEPAPGQVQLAIVAESPPASGLYFYNPAGSIHEPLFKAVMEQLGYAPTSKQDGLLKMKGRGVILVDATYEPVDKLSGSKSEQSRKRDEIIARDYPLLREDLARLAPETVVLIKANVCKLLGPKLKADGFNVLNCGRPIPFPVHWHRTKFRGQFAEVVAMPAAASVRVDATSCLRASSLPPTD
jgi:hypothetical protein